MLRLPAEAGQRFTPTSLKLLLALVSSLVFLSAGLPCHLHRPCSRGGTVPRPTPGLVFCGPAQHVPRGL